MQLATTSQRLYNFMRIPPVGHVLVLVPRFDREFVMTFQRHGYSAAGTALDLNSTLFSTKVDVSIKEFSENEFLRKDHTLSFLAYHM